jgi:UDP-GlcNAc:undecaprenyl-phosphate/decaprenyl-phosphate GlcNAc-1-phosphate transferase
MMNTLLITFCISFALSLGLAPLARTLGRVIGALDSPGKRKIHLEIVPRVGGLSILLSFLITLAVILSLLTDVTDIMAESHTLYFFLAGALICFGTGFADDLYRLSPWYKLGFQILAALSAYAGGLVISTFIALPFNLDISGNIWLNLPLTVFWFVLIINAVNLVDGLDGLAAGITLFTCMVMVVFLMLTQNFSLAVFFALLGGSVAGFLPYNFKENGKIFLGDGGSYFIGYCVAAFSVMGSVKGQVGAALIIPLLAMGLPVFEALFSPIRRIILARNPMHADSGHIHHHLLRIGFSSGKAVLILYCLTLILGLYAIILINIKVEKFGLFLLILGVGVLMFVFLKVMGYFNYIDKEKFSSWLGDFSFVTGVAKDRRRFLDLQVAVTESKNLPELWENICRAMKELDMDFAEIHLDCGQFSEESGRKENSPEAEKTHSLCLKRIWTQNGFHPDAWKHNRNLFKLELPVHMENCHMGEIFLIKDLSRSPINHYTLTRIEHLRRSISRNLKLQSQQCAQTRQEKPKSKSWPLSN